MKEESGQDSKNGSEAETMLQIYTRYGSLGLQMVLVIIAFILCGHWLDKWIGWRFPTLTLVLSFVGLAGAIWLLFKETRKRS